MYYLLGITAAVPARQKATPSMRRENDPTLDTRSTFPITASSASESSTVGSSTYTTENNNSQLTRGHELLVVRSPQEQHERVVFKHVPKSNYFLDNKLLCKYQSGFVPGCSTVHQLIEIFHKICISLDKKEFFCSFFL